MGSIVISAVTNCTSILKNNVIYEILKTRCLRNSHVKATIIVQF